MHREQQELLDQLAGVTSPSTRRPFLARWRSPEAQAPAARHGADGGSTAAATPPGFEKLEYRRSAEPWESALMRRQSKSPSSEKSDATVQSIVIERCDGEAQTDVHLEHSVKSITWIPMPDDVSPVYDVAEDCDSEIDQNCHGVLDIDELVIETRADLENSVIVKQANSDDVGNFIIGCLMTFMIAMTAIHMGNEQQKKMAESEPERPDHPATEEKLTTITTTSYSSSRRYLKETAEELWKAGKEIADGLLGSWKEFRDGTLESENLDEDFPEGWFNDDIPESSEDDVDILLNGLNELTKRKVILESAKAKGFPIDAVGSGGKNEERKSEGLKVSDTRANRHSNNTRGAMRAKLRRGITVDSGSHHNVMPKRLVKQSRIRESEFSRKGLHYIAANKGRIPNEGEVDFEFETNEGAMESWVFQMAEVNKALASIADRVDNRYRVVFDKDDKTGRDASYMINKKTKQIIKMTRVGNVWIIEATVDANMTGEGFVGRG